MGVLDPRERVLLRRHFVRGMPSEQLAPLYGVHRATISRWLVKAQQTLACTTRARLAEGLGCRGDELVSVLRTLHGEWTGSLVRLLEQSTLR